MTERLPPNVYRVAQRRFDAIPGAPWVYALPGSIYAVFESFAPFGEHSDTREGISTSDTFRFIRFWWELGQSNIEFSCTSEDDARKDDSKWYPLVKGGRAERWYGNIEHIVDWGSDGKEIKQFIIDQYPYLRGNYDWKVKNTDVYFRQGVTWSKVCSSVFAARFLPPGIVPSDAGLGAYFRDDADALGWIGILNSSVYRFILSIISPSINFTTGDIASVPVPAIKAIPQVHMCVRLAMWNTSVSENNYEFACPLSWSRGLQDLNAVQARLANLERRIDDEVYRLYDISDEDRAAIEAELAGEPFIGEKDETEHATRNTSNDEEEDTEGVEPPMTEEELAVRWISYAVGIVLGRFTIEDLRFTNDQPPIQNRQSKIGNAIYRREDFAVGSLPAPDEAEFNRLAGPPESFAHVDDDGGRHVFPAEVEAALRDLAVSDGIAVLDEGHPRDLPALVEQALQLMLDWDADREHAAPNTQEVIEIGAGGDLRKFLERHFFTRWHFRWYRKRPVYWPLQSAKRSYGFVLFHEKIDKSTLYVLQRDYLDHKRNGLRFQIGDLRGQAEPLSGAARKRVERDIDRATQLLDEVSEFAATMERVVREGYEPEPNWIDDGVILRMAPLWELIPIWKREPKKYWERLERGDYDWSHIAMRYWPDRVREACKANESYAIAHGHEEE